MIYADHFYIIILQIIPFFFKFSAVFYSIELIAYNSIFYYEILLKLFDKSSLQNI